MTDMVQNTIDLLEADVNTNLRRPFFYGDPIAIPAGRLPTIAVELTGSDIDEGPTGHDSHLDTITIKVIVDKRRDLEKGPAKVLAHQALVDFVKGVDSDGNLKTDSVVGVLRKQLSLDRTALDQLMAIEYSVIKREDLITEEAWISFSVETIVEVSDRS